MPNMTPSKSVVDALLWLTGTTPDGVATELRRSKNLDPRTIRKALACSAPVTEATLEAVAEHFNGLLTLTGEDLCAPSPALQRLVDRFEEARRAGSAPVTGAPPGAATRACAVHESQYRAFTALDQHLHERRIRLADRTVTLASFTLHTLLRPYLDNFVNGAWKAREVVLYAGTAETATRSGSDRQRELIDNQRDELETDFARALRSRKLRVVRHTAPPTFQGYLIPGVAVCVGLFAWFPTFFGLGEENRFGDLLDRMDAARVSRPEEHKGDVLTLNGHYMPHFQVFWEENGENADFRVLQEVFELYTDTHREHVERTGGCRPTLADSPAGDNGRAPARGREEAEGYPSA